MLRPGHSYERISGSESMRAALDFAVQAGDACYNVGVSWEDGGAGLYGGEVVVVELYDGILENEN